MASLLTLNIGYVNHIMFQAKAEKPSFTDSVTVHTLLSMAEKPSFTDSVIVHTLLSMVVQHVPIYLL